MTYISTHTSDCTSGKALPSYKHPSVFARLNHMLRTKQQRNKLARLSDEALCDIGVTRQQAEEESKRALWDAPANWSN